MNTIIEFCIFELTLSTDFQLKLTILIFWTKFFQKDYFQSKAEKVNSTIELVKVPNFSLKWQFWFFFFYQICPERVFPVENRKIATYYIKLFRTGADKRNGIFISLLLLVAETINKPKLLKEVIQKQRSPNVLWNNCSRKFGNFTGKYRWWRLASFL